MLLPGFFQMQSNVSNLVYLQCIPHRLRYKTNQNVEEIELLLIQEESAEKKKDREYWMPLRKELEQWRLGRKS